jgi:hypothetical protein
LIACALAAVAAPIAFCATLQSQICLSLALRRGGRAHTPPLHSVTSVPQANGMQPYRTTRSLGRS